VRQAFVHDGEAEYLKRLSKECSFEVQELDNSRFTNLKSEEQKAREADLLRQSFRPQETVVLLDERGKQFTSPQFAQWLNSHCTAGRSTFCFAIGGGLGWEDKVRSEAAMLWSFSPLTFPYQMMRLLLVEQLYRAVSIIKGYPYHK
jgi:23S rRNA (pseudouridine1915-N3)-methyltransferase